MHEFNQSLKYDKRMYAADIKGSIAFSKALLKAGILNEEEQSEIARGLKLVEKEWEEGTVSLAPCPCEGTFTLGHLGLWSMQEEVWRVKSLMPVIFSSPSSKMTRTYILPMSVDCQKSSARISAGSCILVEVGMTRSLRTCEYGW